MFQGGPLTVLHAQQFQYVCCLFVSHSRYIHLQVPADKSRDLKLHSPLVPNLLAIYSWRLSIPWVPFLLRCNSINSIPWALIGHLVRVKHSEWSRTKDEVRSLAVISPAERSACFLSPGERGGAERALGTEVAHLDIARFFILSQVSNHFTKYASSSWLFVYVCVHNSSLSLYPKQLNFNDFYCIPNPFLPDNSDFFGFLVFIPNTLLTQWAQQSFLSLT